MNKIIVLLSLVLMFFIGASTAVAPKADGFTEDHKGYAVYSHRPGAIKVKEKITGKTILVVGNNAKFKLYDTHNVRFVLKGSKLFDIIDKKVVIFIKSFKNKSFVNGKYKGSINLIISNKGKLLYSWIWIKGHNINIDKGLENLNEAAQESIDGAIESSSITVEGVEFRGEVDTAIDKAVNEAVEASQAEGGINQEQRDNLENAINNATENLDVELGDGISQLEVNVNEALANAIDSLMLDDVNVSDGNLSEAELKSVYNEINSHIVYEADGVTVNPTASINAVLANTGLTVEQLSDLETLNSGIGD